MRFFYLVRASILGKRGTFVSRAGKKSGLNLEAVGERVNQLYERLKRVTIERYDFQKLLPMYDKPETFFYLDPPYWEKHLYTFNFTREQHERLAEILRGLKGKFILSYNDVKAIRDLYRGFKMKVVRPRYHAQGASGKSAAIGRELLIRNF